MSATRITLLFAVFSSYILCSCSSMENDPDTILPGMVSVRIEGLHTRSADPDENLISDMNIFVFSEDGSLEESQFIASRELKKMQGSLSFPINLVRGMNVTVVCCANMGYALSGFSSLSELKEFRYHLTYPDEYRQGVPMSGMVEGCWKSGENNLTVKLKRMMSKVSLSIDRSKLSSGIRFTVNEVRIGNCPRSASIMGPSAALNKGDVFTSGFVKNLRQVDGLNWDKSVGISEEVSVYMMENMRGELLDDTVDDSGKLVEGSLADVCSYMEIKVSYNSEKENTKAGEYLKYRFYLGESTSNFSIERNCHYHFILQPRGSGLDESGWRLDKTALESS